MEVHKSKDINGEIPAAITVAEKMLSDSHVADVASIVYVGRGIGVVKELREIYYNSKNDSAASDEEKRAIKELIAKLVRHLSGIELNKDDERAQRYAQILSHYRFAELADDKALVAEFESARQSFKDRPNDGHACVRFGWVLHDCLVASARRLKNVKLTQFFLKEFENWSYSGNPNFRDDVLDAIRVHDIDKAKVFLNGPGDALSYVQQGDWKNAFRATAIYIKRNANGDLFQSYRIVKEAGWHLLQEDAEALVSLLHEGVEVWGAFGKKSAKYSHLLGMATAAMSKELKQYKPVRSRFAKGTKAVDEDTIRLAKTYISFVYQWGIENLTTEDRVDSYSVHGRKLSLAGRLVLTLLRCATVVRDADFLSKEKWMLNFAEKECSLFGRDVASYLFRMADLYYAIGDMEKSRGYAINLVRDDLTSQWRWRVLGRTYPKGSQERDDCNSHAKTRESVIIFRSLAKLFSKHVESGPSTSETGTKLEVESAIAEKSMRDARAEALLAADAKEYDGIVLSRVKDVVKYDMNGGARDDKTSLRVWWRDESGRERTDFVSLLNLEDTAVSFVGAPIHVLVVDVGTRKKVIKIMPRRDGMAFDVYPYRVGLVVEKNDSRHLLRVMYDEGKCFLVNFKKAYAIKALLPGDLCRLALFERIGMAPLFLDAIPATNNDVAPSFAKEFDGVLLRERGSRDAHVGDVIVPSGIYFREMVGMEVRGLAAAFHVGNEGARGWRAVTILLTSKDLEVRS